MCAPTSLVGLSTSHAPYRYVRHWCNVMIMKRQHLLVGLLNNEAVLVMSRSRCRGPSPWPMHNQHVWDYQIHDLLLFASAPSPSTNKRQTVPPSYVHHSNTTSVSLAHLRHRLPQSTKLNEHDQRGVADILKVQSADLPQMYKGNWRTSQLATVVKLKWLIADAKNKEKEKRDTTI